jgi:hypothetical protein
MKEEGIFHKKYHDQIKGETRQRHAGTRRGMRNTHGKPKPIYSKCRT